MRSFSAFLAVVWLAASAVPSSVAAAEAKCDEPRLSYRYTKTAMVYELAVDLAACEWWRGTSITLDGSLSRDNPGDVTLTAVGFQGTETTGFTSCADPVRATACSLSLSLEHPPRELMVYRGTIRYPWADGRRVAQLEVTCLSAGDMADCRG